MELKQCTSCKKELTVANTIYEGVQKSRRYDLYLFTCECGSTIAIKIPDRVDLKVYVETHLAEIVLHSTIKRRARDAA